MLRTPLDRIRHALGFEVIGLLLVSPLASAAMGVGVVEVGALALTISLLALAWQYLFNLGFDLALLRMRGRTAKRPLERVLHALLFEAGLMLATIPLAAWWLGISWWAALWLDIGFIAFYLVYALAYNWGYDRLFPVPGGQGNGDCRSGSGQG